MQMPKEKPCKVCGKLTTNRNPIICGYDCAWKLHQEKQAKKKEKLIKEVRREFNVDLRKRKEQLKTRGDYIKDLQVVFNKFIRLRDAKEFCISCGSFPNNLDLTTGSRWDAGHYRSVGANPELRFNEDNCHKQCVKCNRELSGNVANYRIGLIKRIGIERVEEIERQHKPLKWSVMEIKHKIKSYKEKIKGLENDNNN